MFTGLSNLWVLTATLAAAAALTALHFLRSRPRRQVVVTTLFWPQVRSPARPRFLRHRFRYLATLILLLIIASLLLGSLSRGAWSWSARPARYTVIVLDAGMSMNATSEEGPRFGEALREVDEAIERLGTSDRLAVVIADPYPRVLHGFDQPIAGASRNLRQCTPASQPADVAGARQLGLALLQGRSQPSLLHITDRPAGQVTTRPAEASGDIPARTIVVGKPVANAAILSAVFEPEPAAVGRGRLHVRIGFWGAGPTAVPIAIRTAERILTRQTLQLSPGSTGELVSDPIDAMGQRIRIDIALEDAVGADNSAEAAVPRWPPIVAAAGEDIPLALRTALEAASVRVEAPGSADASLVVTTGRRTGERRPQITIVADGTAIAGGLPVITTQAWTGLAGVGFLQAQTGQGSAISSDGAPAGIVPLLTAGEHVVAALESDTSGGGALLLGSALFGEGSTVPNDPAFAQLTARGARHLAGWETTPWSVSAARSTADPAWAVELALSRPVTEVTGEPDVSNTYATQAKALETSDAITPHRSRWPASSLLLIAALALVLVEAFLHTRGRIV